MAAKSRSIEGRVAELERQVAALQMASRDAAPGFGEEGPAPLVPETRPGKSNKRTLAQRVARLEADVASLKATKHGGNAADVAAWQATMGRFKDDPDYEKAIKAGQAWRRRQNKC